MSMTFKVGDIVSLAKWDATEKRVRPFGEGVIIAMKAARSQSGFIVDIRNASGRVLRGLDVGWIMEADRA